MRDKLSLLPVPNTTIRTSGKPLDMVVSGGTWVIAKKSRDHYVVKSQRSVVGDLDLEQPFLQNLNVL